MRAHQSDRLLELVARATPAHLAIREGAVVAVREAEMLAGLGDAIELVFGQVLRQPVAAVLGEVELLGHRVPVEADGIPDASRVDLRAAAVEVEPPDLRVGGGRFTDVARRADVDVELLVRSNADVDRKSTRLNSSHLVISY